MSATLTLELGGEGFGQIEVDAVDVPTATRPRASHQPG